MVVEKNVEITERFFDNHYKTNKERHRCLFSEAMRRKRERERELTLARPAMESTGIGCGLPQ